VPHDPYGDAADPRAAQDAAWRQIVENFGDRALLDDDPEPPSLDASDDQSDDQSDGRPDGWYRGPHDDAGVDPRPAPSVRAQPAEEHFVPPPPPPLPLAEPRRLLGWIGLLGVPVIVLLALVVKVPVPSWLGLMLMAWFVGGFVYLVATMHSGPRDDDDDGAVV
jgi:hypothetical protein